MSEYNNTVLTNAGLDLMARANKGTAKFTITRAATSTEQLSDKSMADLQQLTELPSLMQYGVINDMVDSSQDSKVVIGVELVFNNQDLANGYNINTIGLFAKEEGSTKEILYAVTTAVTPETMPDFKNKVLFKFNLTMFVAVSRADNVTVNVTENIDRVKGIAINNGIPVIPDKKGIANLDLSSFIKTVGGKKPDKNGNVSLITSTFNHEHVNLDKIITPGIYKLNGTPCYINDKYWEYCWGYLIVIKSPYISSDFIQFLALTTYGMVNNYYRVVADYGISKDFKRLIDDHDYLNLDNKIDEIDHKELIHHCDSIDDAMAYSKKHPDVLVTTP